jgi:processive 1,2-diacylglycerol beta-glucosyltransferase
VTVRRALFLSGTLGAGHDTLAEACAAALAPYGVESRIVDCLPMLGGGPSAVGNWVFRRLLALTPVYDGFHFSQLRGNGAVGRFMDRTAVKVMFPRLVEEVDGFRPDLLVSVFATGASAAVHLKEDRPDLATVVFMTDSFAYGMWAHEGTDLFLVTSELAAASIRSYHPDARVAVVEAPVRPGFYRAPSQADARATLGVPPDARCILIMSGAWGIGPSRRRGAGAGRRRVVGARRQRDQRPPGCTVGHRRPPVPVGDHVRVHRPHPRTDGGE